MAVAAPPQPPQVDESAGHDPGEALIKEAKQRARRRRWLYGGVATVVAILVVAAFTIPTSNTPPPNDATPHVPAPEPVPLGAPLVQGPDPASTLLTSWGQIHVGYAFVYADGRVIWAPEPGAVVDADGYVTELPETLPPPSAWSSSDAPPRNFGAIERHLSARGLAQIRDGTLAAKDFLMYDHTSRDGQRSIGLTNPYVQARTELWAEPTARLYEAPTYAICHTPAALAPASAQLPASAQALLSGKQRTVDPKIGWSASSEPMPGNLQMLAELERAFPSDCFEVTAEESWMLFQILHANGLIHYDESAVAAALARTSGGEPQTLEWFGGGSRLAEIRGVQHSVAQISSEPIYPHGQPVRWGG